MSLSRREHRNCSTWGRLPARATLQGSVAHGSCCIHTITHTGHPAGHSQGQPEAPVPQLSSVLAQSFGDAEGFCLWAVPHQRVETFGCTVPISLWVPVPRCAVGAAGALCQQEVQLGQHVGCFQLPVQWVCWSVYLFHRT